MSENTTEDTQAPDDGLAKVPADAPESSATGYAVYDRTLGQFVGSVTRDKPSQAKADKAVRKGHTAAVVRV